jgi:nucleotide-binding universal stress UspA family protein
MTQRRAAGTLGSFLPGKEDTMSDTRPILFATDGSPSAAEAQRNAFELARLLHAPLLVVSVAHATLPTVGYSGYGYSDVVARLTEAEHGRVEQVVDTVAADASAAEVPCFTVVADGVVVDEICRIAQDREARLIVVGSHGWGAARRLFSGSVSTGLVHTAPCPVLVVRGSDQPLERPIAA